MPPSLGKQAVRDLGAQHLRMCEVLGSRGIWLSEERRGWAMSTFVALSISDFPTTRWLLAVVRVLVEKHHMGSANWPSDG